jgi:hypothetical protein
VLPPEPEWLLPGPAPEATGPTVVDEASPAATLVPVTVRKPRRPRPPKRDLTLEEVAALRASLHYRPEDEDTILEGAEVKSDDWERQDEAWDGTLSAAATRGDVELLAQFDDAYYRMLERERGEAIDAETYAALELAVERDRTDIELARRQIPAEAFFPVKRRWTREMIGDPKLRQTFRDALESARAAG